MSARLDNTDHLLILRTAPGEGAGDGKAAWKPQKSKQLRNLLDSFEADGPGCIKLLNEHMQREGLTIDYSTPLTAESVMPNPPLRRSPLSAPATTPCPTRRLSQSKAAERRLLLLQERQQSRSYKFERCGRFARMVAGAVLMPC